MHANITTLGSFSLMQKKQLLIVVIKKLMLIGLITVCPLKTKPNTVSLPQRHLEFKIHDF